MRANIDRELHTATLQLLGWRGQKTQRAMNATGRHVPFVRERKLVDEAVDAGQPLEVVVYPIDVLRRYAVARIAARDAERDDRTPPSGAPVVNRVLKRAG